MRLIQLIKLSILNFPFIIYGLIWLIFYKIILQKNIFLINAARRGHLAAEMNLHHIAKSGGKDGIYIYKTPVCNQKLFEICTKNLDIISDKKLLYSIKVVEKIKLKEKIFSKLTNCDDRDTENLRASGKNYIKLNNDDWLAAKRKIVAEIGDDLFSRNIIILNVRDEAYLKKALQGTDYGYHSYRNSDVHSYVAALQYLIDEGYSVIRVGRETIKELELSSKYFWDYSKSKIKSDLIDIFMAEVAYACISTGSGYDALTTINLKPTLYINYLPHGYLMSFGKSDYTSFKKLRDTQSGNFLTSIDDIHSRNVFSVLDGNKYWEQGIEVVNLNSSEIKSCVKKFFDDLQNTNLSSESFNTDFSRAFEQLLESDQELSKLHGQKPIINIIEP